MHRIKHKESMFTLKAAFVNLSCTGMVCMTTVLKSDWSVNPGKELYRDSEEWFIVFARSFYVFYLFFWLTVHGLIPQCLSFIPDVIMAAFQFIPVITTQGDLPVPHNSV